MDESAIFEKIAQVMSDLFDLDRSQITRESRFQDLGITSIDAIDLVVELQRVTGKKLSAESGIKDVRTIGDVVMLVQRHVAGVTQP
ncbi:acyl carrier protein [Anaeromyxobacter oryzisoli]|uniref:acyl carrier protein n=1 Tax=Anaeromyxobacter oryzisoli TaxID=2925408 RepID=UPI001F569A2D|nr:acyl carrier protein [Anaeromyxobacter sp. SG63]